MIIVLVDKESSCIQSWMLVSVLLMLYQLAIPNNVGTSNNQILFIFFTLSSLSFLGVGFAASTPKSGLFGTPMSSPSVRNAHLAESQAEIAAANVARYLQSLSPQPNRMEQRLQTPSCKL